MSHVHLLMWLLAHHRHFHGIAAPFCTVSRQGLVTCVTGR